MTRFKFLLVLLLVSISLTSTSAQTSDENMPRRLDSLEFRVDAVEREMNTLQDSSTQIVRMTFQFEQLRGDFNDYITVQEKLQEKQNNRLWQFLIGPVLIGIVQLVLLPRLVSKRVDNDHRAS
jgi:hypothetical protein